jgi:hypothetical protein
VFFGAITVSLLSFTHDAYSNRGTPPAYQHKIADDVVDALLLVSLISSMSVAALRHPRNIRLTTRLLNLAFISCLIGVMIFTWTSLKRGVAISLTVFVALLGLAFSRSNDLARGDDTGTLRSSWLVHGSLNLF